MNATKTSVPGCGEWGRWRSSCRQGGGYPGSWENHLPKEEEGVAQLHHPKGPLPYAAL